ncbi:MAG: hypothetical protein CVV03_03945 [Firmicutes bacterium HGW-Firmicutes-8]|nr:MAG: hypothetical protein CVV03_03945 [Firmicutes bacterium HGW-Firmicutes-8]
MDMVNLSRRSFLKLSGMTGLGVILGDSIFDLSAIAAQVKTFKIRSAKATPTICPYCSCGCGLLAYTENGQLINLEGDPDNPVNQGSLCSKGASIYQLYVNDRRLTKPLYRAPGATEWVEKDWDWMLDKIVEKVKATRDKNFTLKQTVDDPKTGTKIDVITNRTDAIASLGGAGLDNEECYLLHKLMRGLGIVYLEHQARI